MAFQEQDWVKRVIDGVVDAAGDKYAGTATGVSGEPTFYVSGPVFDATGTQTGVVVIGKSLDTLTRQMRESTLGLVSLYSLEGKPLSSTLYTAADAHSLDLAAVLQTISGQDQSTQVREIDLSDVMYSEILGPWEVRTGADIGVMGVALTQAFLVQTSRGTQVQIFVIATVAILLVVAVGLLLANLITRPLMRLVAASSEVAQGNLEVKVDAAGDDEVAVLAQSFNYMVAGLQEGSIYRDLLGRTVSPEVREQLRQTFTSGRLRLEGQEAVATVLLSDIRGFTTLSEQADPATVFQWLNEYFGQLVPVVTTHGGVVNKFDGDAMLAFFGTLPRLLNPKQSALAACQTAVEMLRLINALNASRRQRGEPEFVTGIGVNTGVVIAGGLGTSDRLHYTIIGDTVNTTSRLEVLDPRPAGRERHPHQPGHLYGPGRIPNFLPLHPVGNASCERQAGRVVDLPPGAIGGQPAFAEGERMNVPHAAPPVWRPRAMFWGMMFTLVLIGGLAAIALTLFATDWLDSNHLLGVSLHSPMRADYSADPRGFLVPAVNLNLIGEVLRQEPVNGAPVDPNDPLATVVVVLQTPVPTVTPQFAPTSGGPLPSPTEPPAPTATLGPGETPLPTLTFTATSRATATSTRPAASTATQGPTATQRPTHQHPPPAHGDERAAHANVSTTNGHAGRADKHACISDEYTGPSADLDAGHRLSRRPPTPGDPYP